MRIASQLRSLPQSEEYGRRGRAADLLGPGEHFSGGGIPN